MTHPDYYNGAYWERYVRQQTMALAEEWGLPPGKVRVTGRDGAVAYGKHPKWGWQIIYGRPALMEHWRQGPSVSAYRQAELPILQRKGLDQVRGRLALDTLIRHEFAHVLVRQTYDNKYIPSDASRRYGGRGQWEIKPHGKEWQEVYAALLDDLITQERT